MAAPDTVSSDVLLSKGLMIYETEKNNHSINMRGGTVIGSFSVSYSLKPER